MENECQIKSQQRCFFNFLIHVFLTVVEWWLESYDKKKKSQYDEYWKVLRPAKKWSQTVVWEASRVNNLSVPSRTSQKLMTLNPLGIFSTITKQVSLINFIYFFISKNAQEPSRSTVTSLRIYFYPAIEQPTLRHSSQNINTLSVMYCRK